MGMVKEFITEYCEVIHPNDFDAQDKLFDALCAGTIKVPMEEMQKEIQRRSWHIHLESCEMCQKATRGRALGATIEDMHKRCCDVGKPRYMAYVSSKTDEKQTSQS